jgi:predicted unusual protein kinase regulating ubiquinone biosynthesis (AarF/ABC1/UbiB family)
MTKESRNNSEVSETPPAAERKAADIARGLLRGIGSFSVSTWRASVGFVPLVKLLASEDEITREELSAAIDGAFEGLYRHPLMTGTSRATSYLRGRGLIPNEQSTEELIRFLVDQLLRRSPMPVPDALVKEFWTFFDELFSSPELKGLGELTFDMVRLVLRTYEPTLVEIVNLLKASRSFHEGQLREVMRRAAMVRNDLKIVQRQIKALRHVRAFFQADPKDFAAQARIVAQMVREFGPFFIKLAQVAAASADFLPDELARELAVFHEDVPPMSPEEVDAAFMECYGRLPNQLFLEFDASRPVKSGSIGSVYVAKKPFVDDGKEVLRPVVIKVGRHNIDREFAIGKLVLGLTIMSSQYWAPHSKLAPFLHAMQEQVDEFVAGFMAELDFESEARNHVRFYQRSLRSRRWSVPQLYTHSPRILEMEYLADAASLGRALSRLDRRERRRFQAQVTDRLITTVLGHILVHREMHGDLHPGNVMVGSDGALHIIDWGNVVPLEGRWRAAWDYLAGAILADTDLLADTLVRMSTDPAASAARRGAIKATLDETLSKRKVAPLSARGVIAELRGGALAGLHRRAQAVMHLVSNTQQLGVVLDRDYVHMARALFAVAGSVGSLYEGTPKALLLRDLLGALARLPLTAARELLHRELWRWRQRLSWLLPLPREMRGRLAPPAAVARPVGRPTRRARGAGARIAG